ncbi:hypothetical protein NicSoilC5_12040 [Arthrobacter sp. NicSoilC5]|nr:hypothetical protein NicSoilC5_12040 [Arthrobacter sp. NicSoilC5]
MLGGHARSGVAELRLLVTVVVRFRGLSGVFRRHLEPKPGLGAGQWLAKPADHMAKGRSG